MRLLHVVGTRPNFMKAAPIIAAGRRYAELHTDVNLVQTLVHTGQHYDERMSRIFFDDLGLPEPDYDLGVGSGSHTEQTARVMLALEPVLAVERPDLVLVVGDVNSTLAAALVAAKSGIALGHVEAGLRSRDRTMPEELNRLVTDQLADLLFTTSADANENLIAEGIPADKIHFVGNTMIDSLDQRVAKALETNCLAALGLTPGRYGVVTLHRPANVDSPEELSLLVDALRAISRLIYLVFPIHARTRKRLEDFALLGSLEASDLVLTEPLGYLDFLGLVAQARLVVTDSGGIQEETSVLGVPCITLRKNTERPVTVWEGTNSLVDPGDLDAILRASERVLGDPLPGPRRPQLWDGRAADRIIEVIFGARPDLRSADSSIRPRRGPF